MKLKNKSIIEMFDEYFAKKNKPEIIEIDGIKGRVIYSDKPFGLFNQYEPSKERIITLLEVMELRIRALNKLREKIPELNNIIEEINSGKFEQIDGKIEKILPLVKKEFTQLSDLYSIWKIRPTTSIHMVRAIDKDRIDKIFFYNGNPFESESELNSAFVGEISDGGIMYNQKALEKIIEKTPTNSKISYIEYLNSSGGNFNGKDWLNHPVFSSAIGNKALMEKYVMALQVLNLFDFYHQGKHSGWRPGEMKVGYGRPIALGYNGDAFYPPNNTTKDHCIIVFPKDAKI